MADFFWVGTGNWTGTGNAGRWYTTSGGPTKQTGVPGVGDNAIFDANSGAGTCTLGGGLTGNCLNLYCNGYGAVGPTSTQISGGSGSVLNVYGNVQLSPNQIFDLKQYPKVVMTGAANGSINCNGNTFGYLDIAKTAPASVTLNDDLIGVGNATLNLITGTLNANNKNVTFGAFYTGGSGTRTLTMGSGTWTMLFEGEAGTTLPINTWEINSTTGLTFNKDTATIKLLHARNEPVTNNSQVSGLKTALTSSATYMTLNDVTPFSTANGSTNAVLVGNEVIYYGTIIGNQLSSLTRGVGGTTVLPSVPAGTAVIGVLFGSSQLDVPITAGVAANIAVFDVSRFPQSGAVFIENEVITYTGVDLVNNLFTGTSTPANSHSRLTYVLSAQAKNFWGGGLTYNDLVVADFGYKITNTIYGSNTFSDIKNSQTGFTWTSNSNIYPGSQTLSFQWGQTNTLTNTFTFTGTASYLQYVIGNGGTTLTLPAGGYWAVGTHSQDGGGNTGLYYIAGLTAYISWAYINALPIPGALVTITGLYATLYLGDITVRYWWTDIDDSQTSNWVSVYDAQNGNWVPVDDSQTTTWTPITTI